MPMSTPANSQVDSRSVWVEPTIIALNVAETANLQGRNGGDGGTAPDFTKS